MYISFGLALAVIALIAALLWAITGWWITKAVESGPWFCSCRSLPPSHSSRASSGSIWTRCLIPNPWTSEAVTRKTNRGDGLKRSAFCEPIWPLRASSLCTQCRWPASNGSRLIETQGIAFQRVSGVSKSPRPRSAANAAELAVPTFPRKYCGECSARKRGASRYTSTMNRFVHCRHSGQET